MIVYDLHVSDSTFATTLKSLLRRRELRKVRGLFDVCRSLRHSDGIETCIKIDATI